MYGKYKDRGLQIIGFPCNQFGGQEPGSNQEIKDFVKAYGVEFQMMDKIEVNGNGADPLYTQLRAKSSLAGGDIPWNFAKFLVTSSGVSYFDPKTAPNDIPVEGSL